MLTKGDDYPLHQTPEPVAYTGANRNFYDRFFFNGYNRDGSLFFALAMGVYPYVNIMDGAFSVVVDGIQHNVYGSKIMHMERLDTQVGAVAIDILAPLWQHRLRCDDAKNGIRADLVFTARTPAHEEPRFTRHAGTQVAMDLTRMTQNGTWSGWIEVKGKKYEIGSDQFWGTRDRSWGIRAVGAPDTQPNPYSGEQQFYWLWAPLNFDDFAAHYFLNDDGQGRAWNSNGILIPVIDREEEVHKPVQVMQSWRSSIQYRSGTRHAQSANIWFESAAGEAYHLKLEPQWHFYMSGLGYTHPHFRHGTYHGELETGYDEYVTAEVEPTDIHIQALCEVILEGPEGQRKGQGVLEQFIMGPHKPSGFTELLDMAP
ncbi:MAG: hypothetical protein OEZ23_07660 [Gammaproteobacteria bacterium]|nr:hypothetical protein [Gammaproteobacteria bacterium]